MSDTPANHPSDRSASCCATSCCSTPCCTPSGSCCCPCEPRLRKIEKRLCWIRGIGIAVLFIVVLLIGIALGRGGAEHEMRERMERAHGGMHPPMQGGPAGPHAGPGPQMGPGMPAPNMGPGPGPQMGRGPAMGPDMRDRQRPGKRRAARDRGPMAGGPGPHGPAMRDGGDRPDDR